VTSRGGYKMEIRGGSDEAVDRGYIEATQIESAKSIDYIRMVDRERFLNLLKDCLS